MQEFFAKTTDDFEEERVLNFDDDKTNNFAVFSNDTKIVNESAEHNKVVSADDENLIYIINDIDESVSSLQSGDIFILPYGEEDMLIVKVDTVSVDGTTATITGQQTSMEEVFDYVKIDTTANMDEAEIDTATMDDRLVYNGMIDESEANAIADSFLDNNPEGKKTTSSSASRAIEGEVDLEAKFFEYEIDKKSDDVEDHGGQIDPDSYTSWKVSGTVLFSITGKLKYYIHWSDSYIEISFDYKLSAAYKAEGKIEWKLPLGNIFLSPLYGVYITLRPCFVFRIEGEITAFSSVSGTIGGRASIKDGCESIKKGPDKEFKTTNMKATFFVGISLEPYIVIVTDKFVDSSLKVEAGMELTTELDIGYEGGKEIHTCNVCLSGEGKVVISLEFSAKFFNNEDWKFTLDPIKLEPIKGNFYYSFDNNKFGWGECPYKMYLCEIDIVDAYRNPVSGAVVYSQNSGYSPDENQGNSGSGATATWQDENNNILDYITTNSEGVAKVYLHSGKDTLIATKGDDFGSKEVNVDSSKKIKIIVAPESPVENEWIDLFKKCCWWIDSKGKLTIRGSIPDIYKKEDIPWTQYSDIINEIYIEPGTKTSWRASYLFSLPNVTKIDLSNLDTSATRYMDHLFDEAESLTQIDLSNFDTSNVKDMSFMFYHCFALTACNLSNFDTSKVTDMGYMFSHCYLLNDLDLSSFNTSKVTNMGNMFYACNLLKCLELSNFNTSNVTDMEAMFSSCHSLTNLDLRGFNTSNVTNMRAMFAGSDSLTNLDLSSFNTSNVTDMFYMFYYCDSLTDLDLSNFDTSNVVYMGGMFEFCISLTVLDVSSFNTSHVVNMDGIFSCCQSLTALDLSGFHTSNVTDMGYMFSNCDLLTDLDLSSFDTSNVTDMTNMFCNCRKLQTIIVSNHWNTKKVIEDSYMFKDCNSLIGCAGTVYISSKVDSTYAHIDGGTSNPGYFTAKSSTSSSASARVFKTTSSSAGAATTTHTESYTDLKPNEIYNFYVMASRNAPISDENLYYIGQSQADENGEMSVTYAPTVDDENADIFLVAYSKINITDTQVSLHDLTYNSETQYIKPRIIYNDYVLEEGKEYELTGEYYATDVGEYTATITGLKNFTGSIDVTYNIVNLDNTSSLSADTISIIETSDIVLSATGGVGDYTFYYYYYNPDQDEWELLGANDSNLVFQPKFTGENRILVYVTDDNGVTESKELLLTATGYTVPLADATCTENGNEKYFIVDGRYYEFVDDQYVEVSLDDTVISPLGHDWNETAYTWSDDNTSVTATRTCKRNAAHTETETVVTNYSVSIEPTCTASGMGIFTASFANTEFEVQTKAITIDAIGHTHAEAVRENVVDATYTNDGSYDRVVYCSVCGEELSRETVVVPKLPLVHHDAVAPTCTEDGTVEYWHDEVNNKYFLDAEGVNEALYPDGITAFATGHTYGTPIWSWANNGNGYTATMKSVCSKCGDVETYNATVTSSTDDGVITYTATATVDGVEYTSVQEVNVSYTFDVVDGTITKGQKDSYSYGDAVTVQADESKDGKYFSGWYVGNTRITTKQRYTFYVKSNMTVTAKYEGAAVQEEQADVSVMITRTNIANSKQKVVFSLNWALPEGCTLKEAGIVRRYDSTDNLTLANVDGSDIKKNTSTLRTRNGNCNFNLTVSATTKLRSINAVAYVTYIDKNGDVQTVYSTVKISEYNN